jgi:malate dehydrogenase
MSTVAILGAGALGGALAHRLAARARIDEIRIVDEAAGAATGKALDIQQAGPIQRSETRLTAAADALAAAGASVVVVADAHDGGEWIGERGLQLVEGIVRAGSTAPIVFAGPNQAALMEQTASKLGVPADRLIGTAPSAVVGQVRALVGADADVSGVDVSVTVAGRPPTLVIGWSSATIAGSAIGERLPAHRMRAISSTVGRLWPPGPYAIASATALVVEALASRSRRRHQALAILDGEFGARGIAAMLLLELGHGRVLGRAVPTLSPQERTAAGF